MLMVSHYYYYSYINQEISGVLVEFDKEKGCLCFGEEEFDLLDLDLMNISIVGWFG